MKFKPSHTTAFMLTSARAEADGYFELTNGSPGKVSVKSQDHVSVQVSLGRTPTHLGRITWRRGGIEVTGDAIGRTLDAWRK